MDRRVLLGWLTALAGCSARPTDSSSPERTTGSTPPTARTPFVTQETDVGLPNVRPDGNPVVTGQADLRGATVVDVDLPASPKAVAGLADVNGGSRWAALLGNGSVVGVRLDTNGAATFPLRPDRLDGPPLLLGDEDRVLVPGSLAPHTHPVPVAGGLTWVRSDGRLRTPGGIVAVDALPDAVPVTIGNRVFVLSEPTRAYTHGVLGDEVEAGSVASVDAEAGRMQRRLVPPSGTVIEGRSAMLADLGGEPAIVVTASDAQAGARLVAFGIDSEWQATGPPVGGGYRWRHQLAVAPFGPGDEQTVAVVKTPHIGGVAEFYRRDGQTLRVAASDAGGYQTHEIGSRTLGGALAGRFAGDNRWLLVVPDRHRENLLALDWREAGNGETVEQVFSLSLPGKLTSNLHGVAMNAEEVILAAGTDAGLRFFRG